MVTWNNLDKLASFEELKSGACQSCRGDVR